MASDRPAKRIRQACEPCRRKKSRCPGERPLCSHCSRLQQNCYYADEGTHRERDERAVNSTTPTAQPRQVESPLSNTRLEDRLRVVEAQLSDVLAAQNSTNRSTTRQQSASPIPLIRFSRPERRPSEQNGNLPSWERIADVGESYLLYCDSQPLPLFDRRMFHSTLRDRSPEVLFAVLALASRFTEGCSSDLGNATTTKYVEEARTIVSRKLFEGEVELSTIQCLCLLSLVDFTNGETRRASIHSSLAMNLAHNADLTCETYRSISEFDKEERRRCFWSLFLLKRLHGADFSILDFSGEENFPFYPSTPDRPHEDESHLGSDEQQKGIVAYVIQLSQVWFKITKYARRRGKPSVLPPWSPQSEYSTIMAEKMEFETRMPYIHRFKPARFSQRPTEELNANRDYWGPWVFLQIVYHTNLCLLNHPLLLSLRLRNFKSMYPEIFLQHTSDLISSHASWIIHIIDILAAKSFKITDPFLGYCISVVATIYLQESFANDPETRSEKRECFNKCLDFVRGIGHQWPHVSRIAEKLQKLGETVSATYISASETDTDTTRQTPTPSLLINLGLFWEILEYSSASEVPGSARHLFGPTLYSGSGPRGIAMEIAQTSPLPEPTRVDVRRDSGRDGSVAGGGSASASNVNNIQDGIHGSATSGMGGDGSGREIGNLGLRNNSIGSGLGMEIPFVYSDDELAVLAESFFNQNQSQNQRAVFEPGVGSDWWNTGNL